MTERSIDLSGKQDTLIIISLFQGLSAKAMVSEAAEKNFFPQISSWERLKPFKTRLDALIYISDIKCTAAVCIYATRHYFSAKKRGGGRDPVY